MEGRQGSKDPPEMISGRTAQATRKGGPISTSQRTNRRLGAREAGTGGRVTVLTTPQ